MKNKKTVLAILVLVVLVAAAAVCWFAFGPKAVAGNKTVVVDVTHKDGQTNTFTLETAAEYLGEAMQEQGMLEGEDGPYGLYVMKVNGIAAIYEEDGSYWAFYENGQYGLTGVDLTDIDPAVAYSFVQTKD